MVEEKSDSPISSNLKTIPSLVLIGPRSSGKTTIGKILAKKLGFLFKDVYDIAKNENQTINELINIIGGKKYRTLESLFLEQLINSNKKLIVATGGGTVASQFEELVIKNWKSIKQIGLSIYLNPSKSMEKLITIQVEREKARNDRFVDINELRKLAPLRYKMYQICDIEIVTGKLNPFKISEIILEKVKIFNKRNLQKC